MQPKSNKKMTTRLVFDLFCFVLKLYEKLRHGSIVEYLPSMVKFSGPGCKTK